MLGFFLRHSYIWISYLLWQLKIDGDFLYLLADAAAIAVGKVAIPFVLLNIYLFQVSDHSVCKACSFNMAIQIDYAPLLFKQKRMGRI